MLNNVGRSDREEVSKMNRNGPRTSTRRRRLLAGGAFMAFMLLFRLYTSTVRVNALVESLQTSNELNVPQSDLRILIVGLVFSLNEINERVTESLVKLCATYNEPEIHIVHHDKSAGANSYQQRLEQAGCRVSLMLQDDLLPSTTLFVSSMNRFQRLALLRSLQRQEILQRSNSHFDAVINLDFDVTDFPSLGSLVHATRHAANNTIVCANGYETWYLPWGKARLYYDTLAAIDVDGKWWYHAYAANLWQILTFGQARLFYTLLQSPATFEMQSCFGGLAVYDYSTWSTQECDYTTRSSNKWELSTEYTLPSGDACEHVVFQQCLRHALPHLEVGIQPTLLIGRDAALFSTKEAKMGLFKIVAVLAVLSFVCMHAKRRRKLHKHNKKKTLPE